MSDKTKFGAKQIAEPGTKLRHRGINVTKTGKRKANSWPITRSRC